MLTALLVLLLALFVQTGAATMIQVPGDYSNIALALEATSSNDTVWVHPGTYDDRLVFPSHDLILISDYFVTGDSNAIGSTIIDATSFAELDTASVLTFVDGNTRSTFVGGFTLMGGHGHRSGSGRRHGGGIYIMNSGPTIHSCWITENRAHVSPAIYSEGGGARIAHCEISHNCGEVTPGVNVFALGGERFGSVPTTATVLFEWNDVYENTPCEPEDPMLDGSGLSVSAWPVGGQCVAQYNHFHDYECQNFAGIAAQWCTMFMQGNVFERIHVAYMGPLIVNHDAPSAPTVIDNVLRDITLHDGSCFWLNNSGSERTLLERNWFENDSNSLGPSVLWMTNPRADVRDNVFLNCGGFAGAVQFTQEPDVGCDVLLERNRFFSNRASGPSYSASAFTTAGAGSGCTIRENWFEGNEGVAVGVGPFDDITLDVSGNYWGDPSGPYDSVFNPNGQGDTLGIGAFATWWLTEPPLGAEDPRPSAPITDTWTLEQAYPNPFNAVTTFEIRAARSQPFVVQVFNLLGQRVAIVWRGVVISNTPMRLTWNGSDDRGIAVSTGIYYVVARPSFNSSSAPKTAKVVLLR